MLQKLGSRIRLYRKACGMSLEELAGLVHKSKASISKYELGQIVMDVLTLTEIANALGVTPLHLLEPSPPAQAPAPTPSANHPFGKTDTLYLYHMSRKRVYASLLKIGAYDDSGSVQATLYYKVGNLQKVENCHCVYHGHMYNHQMVLSFFLRNYYNAVENVFLNFSVPMYNTTIFTGMISGLDESLSPTARKVILSKSELPMEESLLRAMQIGPEALKEVKRSNGLSIRAGNDL